MNDTYMFLILACIRFVIEKYMDKHKHTKGFIFETILYSVCCKILNR